MLRQLRTATVLLFTLTLLTGVIYPAIVTLIAQGAFPHQANGSLMRQGNETVGSELIGQSFTSPRYFWGRLSATGPVPYNAAASSGSNFGPMNAALKAAVEARIAALRAAGCRGDSIPVDLVTSSASGLDPHISQAAAEFQIERVAAARGLAWEAVRLIVREQTQGRTFGILGEPRVSVLELNLALDHSSR